MKLSQELNFAGVKNLWEQKATWWQQNPLDLSAVTKLDSSGVALLVQWALAQKQQGQQACLTGVSPAFISLAKLYNVSQFFAMKGLYTQNT